ncbi:MAG: metallophosphoesterase [Bacilli bacterium]
MQKNTLKLLLFSSLMLSSCQGRTYTPEDYRCEVSFTDDFQIMFMTDLHLEVEADFKKEYEHLNKMITSASPDLIVLTGDTFLHATKDIVRSFFNVMDSYRIPYCFTYGNHDLQGDYDYYYINERLKASPVALFADYADDELTGLTNYYVNVKKDGKSLYRLYIIDSNSYYSGGVTYDYDIIHQDQLDHVKAIDSFENDDAVGLAFFHIPLLQYTSAYEAYQQDSSIGKGENREACCPGYKESGAYDCFKEVGIKACFCGHDHINYSDIMYQNEMILDYGIKGTDLCYWDDDLIGYKLITLTSDTSAFGLDSIEYRWVAYE